MIELIAGFIPLMDCACLAVAREYGFAEAEGIELTLVRESSWANIRDRLLVGHFDAAHMLGPMTVASTLGVGHVAVPLVAPFALGLGGNAVTLSAQIAAEVDAELDTGLDTDLEGNGEAAGRASDELPGSNARRGAHVVSREGPDGADWWRRRALAIGGALRRVVARRAADGLAPLTFGIVHPFSCHNYELRYWLAASGIDPDVDVRLVVVPPPLLADSMRAGHVDGFCVGEPWNSVAVEAGLGSIAFPASAVWRYAPEKVLGCRADWAGKHTGELLALVRALYRAAVWCDREENRTDLAGLLSQKRYVGAAPDVLERALAGALVTTAGRAAVAVEDFHVPLRHAATFPWTSHALWFYSQMVRWKQTSWSEAALAQIRDTYRPDLYRDAIASLDLDVPLVDTRLEGVPVSFASTKGTLELPSSAFLDERAFDASRVAAYVASFAAGASGS
jgi:two-component system, oxyanion-binding sensor